MSPSSPSHGLARRAAAVLGTSAIVLASASFGSAAVAAETGDTLTVLNINDFHGRITSTAKPLACTVVNERDAADDEEGSSVLLSAGDNIGASEFASYLDDDNPTLDYLSALGLQASAAGNHEYDKGYEDLAGRVEDRAEFPYLAANVFHEGERTTPAYEIVEDDGVQVAVIGAVTQETPGLTSPGGLEGVEFRDPVESVNGAIDELQDSGDEYDVLVVEYHDGSSGSAPVGEEPTMTDVFTDIVENTSAEADVLMTAHTHQEYAFLADVPGTDGEQRPVLQTGNYGENLGKVTLELGEDGDWDVTEEGPELVPTADADLEADDGCAANDTYQAAAEIADDAEEKGAVEGARPVGSIAGDVTTAFDDSMAAYDGDGLWNRQEGVTEMGDDRARSSTLSDELADSMVWAVNEDSYGGTSATIGVMNPGGVRADLDHAAFGDEGDGVVTLKEANDIVPFVNNLSTVDLTGGQFLEVLEQQWQRDENGDVPSRPYLQLGLSENVDYTFDEEAEEGSRITSVHVDGEELDPEATYTVVAASFLVDGGDNFWAFQDGANVTDTGLVDRDAWLDYLEAHEEIEPDYSQRGVEVTTLGGEGTEDDPLTVRVSGLESRSLGAPRIDTATIEVDGETFTGDYVQDEDGEFAAEIDLTVPTCSEAGVFDAVITADPDTGTEMPYPVTIERVGGLPPECEGGDGDPEPSEPEPSEPAPSDPGTDVPGGGGAGGDGGPGDGDGGDAGNGGGAPTADDPATAAENGGRDDLARTGHDVAPYVALIALSLVAGIGALGLRRGLRQD